MSINWSELGIADFDESCDFFEAFDRFFATRLAHREQTFRAIFEALRSNPVIIETGALYLPGDWRGNGQSTAMFGHYVACRGGELYTVDNRVEAIETASRIVPNARAILSDSVQYLIGCDPEIDLLYLDTEPDQAGIMHELAAAMPVLSPRAIVAVDDRETKAPLVSQFMRRIGAQQIVAGHQIAWRMP